MVRIARPGRLSSLSFSLVALAVAAVPLGCGGGGKKSTPGGNAGTGGAALHMVSAPVHNTQVGTTMAYQAALSQPGAATWTM
jgi:hypothetical protein